MFQKFVLSRPLTEHEILYLLEKLKESDSETVVKLSDGLYILKDLYDTNIDPTFFIFEDKEVRVLSANPDNPTYTMWDFMV